MFPGRSQRSILRKNDAYRIKKSLFWGVESDLPAADVRNNLLTVLSKFGCGQDKVLGLPFRNRDLVHWFNHRPSRISGSAIKLLHLVAEVVCAGIHLQPSVARFEVGAV